MFFDGDPSFESLLSMLRAGCLSAVCPGVCIDEVLGRLGEVSWKTLAVWSSEVFIRSFELCVRLNCFVSTVVSCRMGFLGGFLLLGVSNSTGSCLLGGTVVLAVCFPDCCSNMFVYESVLPALIRIIRVSAI